MTSSRVDVEEWIDRCVKQHGEDLNARTWQAMRVLVRKGAKTLVVGEEVSSPREA